jgi:hypothetical protein
MSTQDRHRFRSVINLRLTTEQFTTIQQILPQQKGMTAKLRYILKQVHLFAQSCTEHRVEPKNPVPSEPIKYYAVRVPKLLYDFVASYASGAELDVTKQATSFVLFWLEQQQELSQSSIGSTAKGEYHSLAIAQKVPSRVDDFRQGLRLIWKALRGGY